MTDTTTRTYAVPMEATCLGAREDVKRHLRAAGLSAAPAIGARTEYARREDRTGPHNDLPWEPTITITGPSRLHSTMLARYPWTGK